jgi:2-keto-4-pentenoate hydratase
VHDVDQRLVAATERQLRDRKGVRVGWKLGIGDRERIEDEIAVGHLTSATPLEPGSTYSSKKGELLHADAEVAVEIGNDGRIARHGAALELVDLRSPPDTPDDVVAGNVFHRAVAFSSQQAALPAGGVEGRLIVNGEVRAAGWSATDLVEKVAAAARILAAVGERLEAGDLVITGSVVQVPVARGDRIEADFGPPRPRGIAHRRVLERSQPT